MIFAPDTHVPHHDEAALSVFSGVLRRIKPRRLVVLGDLCDMTVFSRFGRSSMKEHYRDLGHDYQKDTLAPAGRILKEWSRHAGEVVFVEGNHENWVSRWCANNGPAGQALWSLIDPRKHLGFSQWVDYIPDDGGMPQHFEVFPESARSTALWATHGYSHSARAAASHLSKVMHQVSIVHGHTHKLQDERLIDPVRGREIRSISAGCLSKRQPYYKHGAPSGYQHGFVIAYGKNDGSSWASFSCSINNGATTLPGGEEVLA